MPRYIDAIKLIKEFQALPCCRNGYSDEYDKARIFAMIDNQPIADVVEVVRCKDCKWSRRKHNGLLCCDRFDIASGFDDFLKEDWFCADGERRRE